MPLPRNTSLVVLAAVLSLAGVSGCGGGGSVTYTTTVAPLPTEDLAGACTYDLLLQRPEQAQTGVLVFFDRADTSLLYQDASVRQMAASLGYAIVFAHQCYAKSYDDLQVDASKGPGRALFAALGDFATLAKHPELANLSVYPFGFSAAGELVLTLANFAPQRMAGGIAYAPGNPELNLLHVTPAAGALKLPILILANNQDTMVGTTRPLGYFLKARSTGAPWAFAVQNNTIHCCTLTTRSMVLAWLPAIAQGETASPQTGYFACTPDGVVNMYGETNCAFTSATVGMPASSGEDNSWMPDATAAQAWLAWVTNPNVNQ